MKCQQVQERLPLYVESDLDTSEANAVSAHVTDCVACGQLLNEYRNSQSWLRDNAPVPEQSFVDSVAVGVAGRIAASKANGLSLFEILRLNPWKVIATAAMIALLTAAGWYLVHNTPSPEKPMQSKREIPQPKPIPNYEKDRGPELPQQRQFRPDKPRVANKAPRTHQTVESDTGSEPALATADQQETDPSATNVSTQANDTADQSAVAIQAIGPLRLEIHTSDPNIRIIWFASSPKPASEP